MTPNTINPSVCSSEIVWLAVDQIRENLWNPRLSERDATWLFRFGLELKEQGFKQPLRAFQRQDHYVLISGELRLQAAKSVGLTKVPVIIEPAPVDEQAFLRDQLSENQYRNSFSPLEEADVFQRLKALNHWSNSELARQLRITESEVCRILTIKSSLAAELLPHVHSGALPASTAYEIAKCRDQAKQVELADRVINQGMTRAEVVLVVKSLSKNKKGMKSKPLRLERCFDASLGYDSIRDQLLGLLEDLKKAEKSGLPPSCLGELWSKRR
jgi:ParB family transcriptional regulator, chromosome partitioning protein